jgi:hypothetical protein
MKNNNISQDGGVVKIKRSFPGDNVRFYSGVGVILIEMYYDKITNRSGPALILFRQRKSNKYTDAGGFIDKNIDSLSKTASKELNEESCNLINISLEILNKSVSSRTSEYRTYFVYIENGIRRQYYYHNLNNLNGKSLSYHETNDMTRVFIDDFNNMRRINNNNDNDIIDVYNKTITIDNRTINTIDSLLKYGVDIFELIKLQNIMPHKVHVTNISKTNNLYKINIV